MRGSNENILMMVTLVVAVVAVARGDGFVTWHNNYYTTWGHQALVLNETSELHLTLDHNYGSGFESNLIYGSGFFNMRIKAPQSKPNEVITSFYLISKSSRHDELRFEIFGNGPHYLLNTNMFLYGEGNKEQRFRLWFDPTKDYHSYKFLWNPYQVVFYVDDTPIRVFNNKKNSDVYYPAGQTMFVGGSVENESRISPTKMQYTAKFQASKLEGCETTFTGIEKCTSSKLWWNRKQLNSTEMKLYMNARKMYMDYDYCSDRKRYPKVPQDCKNYT